MVRQTKRFKKGLNKKVLSAILAASMIMTSSSFAFAAPVDGSLSDDTATATEANAPSNEEAGIATLSEPEAEDSAVASVEYKEENFNINVDDSRCVYNGKEQKPNVTIELKGDSDNTPLTEEKDFKVYCSNNVNAGTAEVRIQFIGTYADTADIVKEYEIAPMNLREKAAAGKVHIVTDEVNDTFVYNGTEQYPEIQSVTVDVENEDGSISKLTLDSEDYDIVPGAGDDMISADEGQSVVIQGKGNYTDRVRAAAYEIQQAELSTDLATINVEPIIYDNGLVYNNVKGKVTVIDNGVDYTFKGNEYSLEFLDETTGEWTKNPSKDLGTHTMRVIVATDTTNFVKDSYVETTYEVVADGTLAMAAANAKVNGNALVNGEAVFTYTGEDQFVEDANIKLGSYVQGVDYEVVTPEVEWVNAGEYTIELVGLNKLEGQTATIPVKIAPKAMVNTTNGKLLTGSFEATVEQGTHPTSGELSSIVVTVKDKDLDNKTLEEGTDYTYEVVTKDDKQYVEITGIGNYTTESDKGAVYTQIVDVDKDNLDLDDPSISVEVEGTYNYTGNYITLDVEDVIVTENDNGEVVTLRPNSDYYIVEGSYKDNRYAGTATVDIQGKDKYKGTHTVSFKINGTSFADTFELASIADVKKGTKVDDLKKSIKVVFKSTGAVLDSKNYDVKVLKDGVEVKDSTFKTGGLYTVEVTPKDNSVAGRYEGTLEGSFNVVGDDLKASGAKIADIDDVVYTGEEIKPAVVVTVGNKTLEEGKDYTVAYSDNVKGGEATVTVTGINDYSGTLEKNFNITRAAQAIEMTNEVQKRDLKNGSRNSMSKVCTLKLATTMADEDTKYTYTTSDPSVATVNAGKITYQGVGECTITVSAPATDSCEAASLDIKVVVGNPGTPTFTPSVTKNTAKKAFVVTSSTVRGADGFEVQYSIRDDFWKATTKDFSGTKSKLLRQTCTTVHSNMTYYVRVRAYQVVDGEKVYSTSWSPVKTIKTK